ncbi:MAG TPA: DUF2167 domain-containing protein [Cryomorphaceae bacterium]|nr:hypothetical protein [Owenweeksia sp.]HBF20848.1 DUF2167 domain-containing protein [Cryomorphaceae bacterium]HCQ16145.1 DUF2167 domain-containing protein [Cryomorphaceae bacterium]
MRITSFLAALFLLFSFNLSAGDEDSLAISDEVAAYLQFMDSVQQAIQYTSGKVDIGEGLATLNVPRGYKYIRPEQADFILVDVWGNPPGQSSLGMVMPEASGPFDDSSYAIVISYSEEGYVEDDDAEDLDYDDLLEQMQEDTRNWNKERIEMGYPALELVGWASPPFYDRENKKLHWAKELSFEGEEGNTLNYNIRVLGRKGYLELNFIGGMYLLPQVQKDMNGILASVDFNQGNRYADFNPDMDEVAAYGIGGLIAGKVLAKVGFFALLAKFWKIIALAVVGAFAAVKKFFGGRGHKEDKPETPAPTA